MSLTVGVDVGGTKIAAGVVDEAGTIIEKLRKASPTTDELSLLKAIRELVGELRTRHEITAVGVGAPGFIGADRRSVLFTPNLPWRDEPLAELLERVLQLPVLVENDANAAAWAEHVFGAGQGVPDQLLLTLGTGVGGGLVLGGEVYRGGHGVAAEVGHLTVVRDGIPCPCGRHGCLEQYASGSALVREARSAAATGHAPVLLAAAGGNPAMITGAMVTEQAHAGTPEAVELFAEMAEALAVGIGSLVAVLDPSLVLLGGGVSEAGDLILVPTTAALDRELTGGTHRPGPEVRLAALGNDAGLIGAADEARRMVD
jgi:glucokinase